MCEMYPEVTAGMIAAILDKNESPTYTHIPQDKSSKT